MVISRLLVRHSNITINNINMNVNILRFHGNDMKTSQHHNALLNCKATWHPYKKGLWRSKNWRRVNPQSCHRAFNKRHLILHACSGMARLINVPLTVHVFCWQSLCHTLARRRVLQRQSVDVLQGLTLHFYCAFFPFTVICAGWLTFSIVCVLLLIFKRSLF